MGVVSEADVSKPMHDSGDKRCADVEYPCGEV